ncbi:MAG: hypothetical protein WAT74_12905 [Flavobacteriales bacterium]
MKRETVIKTVKEFPPDVDLDALFERLLFLKRLDAGIAAANAGDVVRHEKVVAQFKRKWRK